MIAIEEEKTRMMPSMLLLDRKLLYLQSTILADVGQECVVYDPQKISDERIKDIDRLEHSSEYL